MSRKRLPPPVSALTGLAYDNPPAENLVAKGVGPLKRYADPSMIDQMIFFKARLCKLINSTRLALSTRPAA
jgi:hypothetical protein